MELIRTDEGLTLTDGSLAVRGDFTHMLSRLKSENLHRELLVRAARIKPRNEAQPSVPTEIGGLAQQAANSAPLTGGSGDQPQATDAAAAGAAAGGGIQMDHRRDGHAPAIDAASAWAAAASNGDPRVRLRAVDATAGLGEDSLLLAAAGFTVQLYERNPTVYALLEDALERAASIPGLADIVARMQATCCDSIDALRHLDFAPDVVVLDPMFPAKRKGAAVKKKLQLLHQLEQPCEDEGALLDAAVAARPLKVVIKRPAKGPYLAGRKPDYSLAGKAVRYDCFAFARRGAV